MRDFVRNLVFVALLALCSVTFAPPAAAQPATIPLTSGSGVPAQRGVLFCYNPASSPNYTAGACGATGYPVWITPQTSADSTAPVQVSCGSTATQAFTSDTSAIHREIINNLATGIVYWGKTSGVTTSTGFAIPPGSGYDFSGYSGTVYCIVASGSITVGTAKW